jgi:hypothetical protein
MAFNNLGTVTTIATGATHYWTYWRNNHDNFGTQMATADVKSPGATLVAKEQGKRIENNGQVDYTVAIHNNGGVACLYNLQGGGMS